MSSAWPLTLLALAALPWWWPVWRALLSDLRAAADESASAHAPRAHGWLGSPPSSAQRVQPKRRPAFDRVRRRLGARARWEAGFGRRGL